MRKFTSWLPLSIIVSICLTPLIWFRGQGEALINGIDTNFPLDPGMWFDRRFFVWSSNGNAGGDFSSSTAGLFFHLIQFVPYKLGLSLQQVEIISLIFWFSAIILSSFYLARRVFPNKFLVQFLFVVLYSFNIYIFNTWENVKVANLSLMAAIPIALSILINIRNNGFNLQKFSALSVLTGILLSGSGINPAYFITFFIIIFVYILGEILVNIKKNFIFSRLTHLLVLSIIVILVNLFWILPTLNYIFSNIGASASIGKIGFTNWIDSLSANTSLLNIMRMQGAWDWYPIDGQTNLPLYIPYAINYFYRFPFIAFGFLLPLLALISLSKLNRKEKHLYVAWGIMLILGIFLGAGTHLPTGNFFRFLSEHLPFFSLFRSPWYIFTPLLILAIAGLVSLLFFNRFQKGKGKVSYSIYSLLILLVIVGNMFYSYPLVTGKIFRPGRLDSFYVKFPSYVFQSQTWLNNHQEGRIIEYPDHEMQNYNWGYRGIESILQLLTNKETLFLPLNNPDSPIASLVRDMYFALKKGEIDNAKILAGKLNINTIFEKKDQKIIAQELPQQIKEFPSRTFDQWTFYQFPNESFIPKISLASKIMLAYPYDVQKSALSILSPNEILVNPEDSVIGQILDIDKVSGTIILAENSQVQDFRRAGYELSPRLVSPDFSKVVFKLEVPASGIYQPVLEAYRLVDFGIDLSHGLKLEIDGRITTWEKTQETQSFIYFSPIELSKGKHTIVLKLISRNLVNGGDFETEVDFKRGGKGNGEGIYEIQKDDQSKYLGITNISKQDIAAVLKVDSFDPMADYYVEAKYKQMYGNIARIVTSQFSGEHLVNLKIQNLPNYPEWRRFSFYYKPERINSDMYIELTTPNIHDPFGTKIFFDDIKINKIFSNNILFLNKNPRSQFLVPTISYKKISPVLYEGEVVGAIGPQTIVFSENYSPQWKLSAFDSKGKSVPVLSKHFSANYFANAWYLDNTPNSYKIKIFYQPQNLFNKGLIISGVTVLSAAILYFWPILNRRLFKKGLR